MTKYEILSICIAVVALFLSLFTLCRQRKRTTVTWQDNVYVLNPQKDIVFANEPYPADAQIAFYTSVKILNPSHINMAFFNLRAFNPKTDANHFLATQKTVLPIVGDTPFYISAFGTSSLDNYFIVLPKRTFGELRAGSHISIDLLVFANKYVSLDDGIDFSFRTSDTVFFTKERFFNPRNWFKTLYEIKRKHYDLTYYEKVLTSKAQQEKGESGSNK